MKTVTMMNIQGKIQVCDDCYFEDRERMFAEAYDPSLGDSCAVCRAYRDARPTDPTYQHHLFSLTEAAEEIRAAKGGGETTAATAKFTGKLLANSTVIGAKFGWKLLKQAPAFAARVAERVAKEAAKRS